MKDRTQKKLISIPVSLLKKIDRLAKAAKQDRSAFICSVLEKKFFDDECKEFYVKES
jgi:metal-responsive CopG/Arc/MetJ family transcriptional regulator